MNLFKVMCVVLCSFMLMPIAAKENPTYKDLIVDFYDDLYHNYEFKVREYKKYFGTECYIMTIDERYYKNAHVIDDSLAVSFVKIRDEYKLALTNNLSFKIIVKMINNAKYDKYNKTITVSLSNGKNVYFTCDYNHAYTKKIIGRIYTNNGMALGSQLNNGQGSKYLYHFAIVCDGTCIYKDVKLTDTLLVMKRSRYLQYIINNDNNQDYNHVQFFPIDIPDGVYGYVSKKDVIKLMNMDKSKKDSIVKLSDEDPTLYKYLLD
ncbi:MAG: hypothetical protein PF588_06370 [Candidatus Kapabacteria bacterium]|jgi:hypothetical protein|nr:hypothetical protein [Candidatus Kapabacteria bacterium]